ncbi:hypothetical protein Tco_0730128 [Tanacetum coccineum]|uniref:Reverse transcriptase domain-containing protein n=1 Tax=Tanacetum coccineum TaxID=301880 RepID=A0ABQ4YTN7_9ASTR
MELLRLGRSLVLELNLAPSIGKNFLCAELSQRMTFELAELFHTFPMYVPELLGFPSDDFSSGNPTSTSEPFTSEFTLEEIDAFLYDKSISLESDHDDCDPEEDIYRPKSSIEEPTRIRVKRLTSHLENAFLEENDKLPIIIAQRNDRVAMMENGIILTRLVTGWRVCIDYRKLNEATRKDHFPLPFMDQMLERLAGNEFYCFLDGFSGYF